MEDLSEQAIKANCPHCDPTSQAFTYLLEQTDNFSIVCDAHPIIEGHMLIIPKQHISCVGAFPKDLLDEFLILDEKVTNFLVKTYGASSSFEHGIFGQTVFHSHIHYLPFNEKPTDIVPEGEDKLREIGLFEDLSGHLQREGGYLFFSIGEKRWIVDKSIAMPRFFRDRFAIAFGRPERGNWKNMRANNELMQQGAEDNKKTQRKWKDYFK